MPCSTFCSRLALVTLLAAWLGWAPGAIATPAQVHAAVPSQAATPVASTPVATPAASAWQSVDCAAFAVNAVVAAVAECGYVTVPENRTRPESRDIQLAVVRIPSATGAGAPIVVGTGGPGGEGLLMTTLPPEALDIVALNAPLLAEHDLVFFAQRGTLDAVPYLTCPQYNRVETGYARALHGWDRAETDAALHATLAACRDHFLAEGVDFAGYTSQESAADVDAIRAALGYDTIIFYGQSYGTQLAQFIMRDTPQILDAVILDGALPVAFPSYAASVDIPVAFEQVFAACAAEPACHAAYPDPMRTLSEVVAAFNADPRPVDVTQADGTTVTLHIDGDNVFEFLFMVMGIGPPWNGQLPQVIEQLHQDPESLLAAMAPSPTSTAARLMQYAVNCSDDPSTSLAEFKLDTLPPVFREYVYADAIKFVDACNLLALPQLPAASDAPVASDIPVLILNGALDPATPPSNADLVAASLPQARVVLFPAGGHIQWPTPCAVSLIAAFLADPAAPVPAECSAAPPVFTLPPAPAATPVG